MHDITEFNSTGLPANASDLGEAMVMEGTSAAQGIGDLLRFASKDGAVWLFGVAGDKAAEDDVWAVHPGSFRRGYICWKDGKPAGELMQPVGTPLPPKDTMEDHGIDAEGEQTKWIDQWQFQLKCVAGGDKDTELVFKTSTRGGVDACKMLAREIGTALTQQRDPVPLVVLTSESYKHPKPSHGTINKPKFDIQSWSSMEALMQEHQRPRSRTA